MIADSRSIPESDGPQLSRQFSSQLCMCVCVRVFFAALFSSSVVRNSSFLPNMQTASLSTLPAVQLQSIMHSLQPKEIIALARSCQWAMQCADSAFAWCDVPPITVHWDKRSSLILSKSRLCRWIPLALTSPAVLREADLSSLLALMDRWPRVVRLGWVEWSLPVECGLQLMSHPSMRNVRDIGLCKMPHVEWIQAIATMDCLRQLDLTTGQINTPDVLAALVHVRSLRFLLVTCRAWAGDVCSG